MAAELPPKPEKRYFYTTGRGGRRKFDSQRYRDELGEWEKRCDQLRDAGVIPQEKQRITCPMCTDGYIVDDDGPRDAIRCDACKGDGYLEV
jgi:hypothetical protein